MSEHEKEGARAEQSDAPDDAGDEALSAEDKLQDDQADAAEDFLNDLLDALDMDGEAVADIEGDWIYVDIDGPDMGLLIGHHGATLEALQELTRAAVAHKTSAPARLILDIEGYRERQHERLERQALRAAEDARRERRPQHLDPMSSYERRLVHEAIRDLEGVITRSEGEGDDRHVVIVPS